ncbi:hypothetical protein QN277_027847 [Acacia crassicarpa]|uniref:NB-ARC domain-containing protein n=1 Tax=Acacia crassicarpa TaxID=499986 RepID=A0AAE1K2L6_9FABA|nr:hypothetical protein QN277_027847 [Acacia crassicarpa]
MARALYGAPENPDFIVGLDQLLNQLKFDLLNGTKPFLNLIGFGGSGKTTLAKNLCWDPQVLDKFKENIFFATFSKTPHMKIIVEKLFEHFGQPKPEFQGNEDPVYKMRNLLEQKAGESPVILVLDDVYRGSEDLVKKFNIPISNLKILATSRAKLNLESCITHRLEKLPHEDSMTLFRHYAELNDTCPQNDLANQIVKCCGGLPLILKIIGSRLHGEEAFESWQIMERGLSQHGGSIVDSDDEVLATLRKSFDVLDDKPMLKKCFMDLGLFPEDQMIPVSALFDIWTELHNLPEECYAVPYIDDLTLRNLSTLVVTRKVASEKDDYYYNNHFLKQHDILRDLAIHLSNEKPLEQRENLIIDINENNHPELWSEPKKQGISARLVSISSGEAFNSKWWSMKPDGAEVLVLNIGSNDYALPDFIKYMRELKVLVLINYSFHPSQIHSFELLGSLPNLKRIRLQRVSVPSLCKLKKLQKLSLYMCTIGPAFESCPMDISDALQGLVELNIDYCKDLVKLPADICKIGPLKKLSITNCHKFSELPKEIGNLENLEVLRLSSCSDLKQVPDSIKRLQKLGLVDISYCTSLKQLPEDFGDVCNLKTLYMKGCSRCELPDSVKNLQHLKVVICDEETAASWETFRPQLPNLTIKQPNAEINLNWLERL